MKKVSLLCDNKD